MHYCVEFTFEHFGGVQIFLRNGQDIILSLGFCGKPRFFFPGRV